MKRKNDQAMKAALGGILCAEALALSWLESLLPAMPFMPPGAKPGFSNIITMFAAESLGAGTAFAVTLFKALFAFLMRGATAGAMSLSGGMLSTLAVLLLIRSKKTGLGYTGISIIGAFCHNLAQLLTAAVMTSTAGVFYYAPFLGIASVVTGAVTGAILSAAMPALEKLKRFFIGGANR